MARLNAAIITELLEDPVAPAVSIYLPTHLAHSPPNMTEDQMRFKNLWQRAMAIIGNMPEVGETSRQAIYDSLAHLQEDMLFWESRDHALGVFVNPRRLITVELPLGTCEYVAVDSRFHIAPLLGLLPHMLEYNILVITEKEPLLFQGDMYGLKPVDADLPASGHSGSLALKRQPGALRQPPKGSGSQPEYFGGRYPVIDDEGRRRFFRAVDRAIREHCGTSCHLVLAGTEDDVAAFLDTTSHPRAVPARLPNANTAPDIRTLFHDARQLLRRQCIRPEQQALSERFEQLNGNGSGRATSELAAIQDAADKGRIETLLLKLVRMTHDNIQDNTVEEPKIVFPPDEQMGELDYLAAQTWRNHGSVMLLDEQSPPRTSPLGAIFRYA